MSQRGLRPEPIYFSQRHRDTEKDSKERLRELRGSVRGNLTCYLIGRYEYGQNNVDHPQQRFKGLHCERARCELCFFAAFSVFCSSKHQLRPRAAQSRSSKCQRAIHESRFLNRFHAAIAAALWIKEAAVFLHSPVFFALLSFPWNSIPRLRVQTSVWRKRR